MSFLSLACRDIFRRNPVRERSSRSLLVRRRSSITGSMRSWSRATRLSTDAHCRTETQSSGNAPKSSPASSRQGAAYALVPGGDVLQRSGRCLSGGGVDLALMQHAVVQAHDLGVPEPLHTLRHPSDLGESGDVLVALPGRHKRKTPLRWTWPARRLHQTPVRRTFLFFLLLGVKQPMASPFPVSCPLVGPSRRVMADGGISL